MKRLSSKEALMFQVVMQVLQKLDLHIPIVEDRWLTIQQVADMLNYSRRQVYRWMKAKTISYIQIGTAKLFSERYIISLLHA
jgi:excisionase family DNA binding protein